MHDQYRADEMTTKSNVQYMKLKKRWVMKGQQRQGKLEISTET